MHEIAKATPVAFPVFVLTTASLSKISDRRQFSVQRSARIPTLIQIVDSSLSFRLPLISCVDVANQVVAHIVAYMQFQKVPELAKFAVKIFINRVKPFLKFSFSQLANRIMSRVMIDVWK